MKWTTKNSLICILFSSYLILLLIIQNGSGSYYDKNITFLGNIKMVYIPSRKIDRNEPGWKKVYVLVISSLTFVRSPEFV